MSIYLPDDLKTRLERLQDQANWSQVAQRAFEVELRLYPEWSEDKMTEVIERLRVSKKRQIDDVFQRGFEAGREWAEEYASYKDLRYVGEKLEIAQDPDDNDRLDMSAVMGEHWGKFFGFDFDDERQTGVFKAGFVRGAGAVWSEVADKL